MKEIGQCSILVSDLSGLTETTRKYGIIHMSSVLARMNQLMKPLFMSLDAISIGDEADDFIVAFSSSKNALLAACLLKQVLIYYNDSLLSNNINGNTDNKIWSSYCINLSGIGLATSDDITID